MDAHISEALRAKANAEMRFAEKDFVGAKSFALKAQMMCPSLDGIAQMVVTFGVHSAAEVKINGEVDLYGILGLDSSANRSCVKKQYKKMAFLLHPDKNRCVGADGAFKFVSEAWAILSDNAKRRSYDHRRNLYSPHTFWTICSTCQVQYEYLRKYQNKKLTCKNCRGVFTAYETGLGPVNGIYPYCTWVQSRENGHRSGHGHESEYASNLSFQRVSGNSSGGTGEKDHLKHGTTKRGRPAKVRKVEFEGKNNNFQMSSPILTEAGIANSKIASAVEAVFKRSLAPVYDSRQLLIDKARTVIRKKLEEIKLEDEKKKSISESGGEFSKRPKRLQTGIRKLGPTTITVPDSDFHDFDKDRAEESFRPKQIWALYDEEDGMPRLYCLVREVLSLKPFKIHISHLNSKSDSEFGTVNWLCSGFTKSCGHFRASNSEIIDQVNVFSHLLAREKARRGGCVRIFPKRGDIWAVYSNWSPDWNRSTPDEVRHQYEMVEVLEDYSEELGVWVAPMVKVHGFKTVYKRNGDKEAIVWIQRREMLRFSHMVPSFLLKGGEGGTTTVTKKAPEGDCWDLDPAAIPDFLLQNASDEELFENKMELSPQIELSGQMNPVISTLHNREKHCQTAHISSALCTTA
ncbi:unnamed protein product [Cuscuta europaea]|uniref:J domain-containing protein n=1 Tax=Cuscuta europaea TaxID=41803 RepID=A0A9P0YJH3_CUSEU|nr:unnamed protein product [Cuscuta europaea]